MATPPSHARSPRRAFALTGPSVALDPLTRAVRADLADVRLAEQVFAPHYAEPVRCTVTSRTDLRVARGGETIATLEPGELFEVLDVAGGHAWGRAPNRELVGYLDKQALDWRE